MRIRALRNARWRHLPAGFRDQTTDDVAARRRLEGRLREAFARWGYAEIATPTVEYLETFVQGGGPGLSDRLLKLVDAGGEVLALRPEMTVPLARFAATRLLPAGAVPLRLSYVATVFRGQERGSGRLREFTQAGVEFIGDAGLGADVEVITLAAAALHETGLHRPALSVGHAGFLRGVLALLPDEEADVARDLLYRRAFADLDRVVGSGPAKEVLRVVPALRGPHALQRARALAATEESHAALKALDEVVEGVRAHGVEVQVDVDLGLIRDFDYYTGIVFEAHAGRAGQALLGGGRYDSLLARFGWAAPATGFAIGLERVLEAGAIHELPRPTVVLSFERAVSERAVRAARLLRDTGLAVVMTAHGAPHGVARPACLVSVTADGFDIDTAGRPPAPDLEALARQIRTALESIPWTP